MFINPVSTASISLPARKNVGKKNGSSNVKIPNVTFAGSYNPINSSRKYIDYGDIFKEGVRLIDVNIWKAKKACANMKNSVWDNVNAQKASFEALMLHNAKLTDVNFENSNLEGAQFINTATNNVNMNLTNLSNSVFKGDKFGGWTQITSANLCGANFKDAKVENSMNFNNSFYDCYTQLPNGFDPKYFYMKLIEKGVDFSNAENYLKHVKLRRTEFDTVNFENSSLKRADLKFARFIDCNMHNTDLTRAYLKSTEFYNCDLSGSKLKQINLTDTELNSVDLRNTNLKGARLDWHMAHDIKLNGAKYDQYTVFKEGFNPKAYGMVYEESPLSYYGG